MAARGARVGNDHVAAVQAAVGVHELAIDIAVVGAAVVPHHQVLVRVQVIGHGRVELVAGVGADGKGRAQEGAVHVHPLAIDVPVAGPLVVPDHEILAVLAVVGHGCLLLVAPPAVDTTITTALTRAVGEDYPPADVVWSDSRKRRPGSHRCWSWTPRPGPSDPPAGCRWPHGAGQRCRWRPPAGHRCHSSCCRRGGPPRPPATGRHRRCRPRRGRAGLRCRRRCKTRRPARSPSAATSQPPIWLSPLSSR